MNDIWANRFVFYIKGIINTSLVENAPELVSVIQIKGWYKIPQTRFMLEMYSFPSIFFLSLQITHWPGCTSTVVEISA